jgi:hypothetical protein
MDSFPGGAKSYGPEAPGVGVRTGRLRGDLALLTQGVEVAVGFGVRSLEGLVDVAELLEHSVYEPKSLRRTSRGFAFTLLNPPLRMGAFSSIRVLWNDVAVDPNCVALSLPGGVRRDLRSVGRDTPVTLPVGQRAHLEVTADRVDRGRHRLRLELQSVAVPPLVWFEFSDDLIESELGVA